MAPVAGRVDVDAQKRGYASKKPGGEEGAPQFAPVARFAIGAFGALGL